MATDFESLVFRLERMETKLDNVSDIVVKIAVTEEKVSNLLQTQLILERRLTKLEESQWFVRLLERVFWIALAALVGATNFLLGR